MEIFFMDTENIKTADYNRYRLYFTSKLDLRGNKTVSLANLSIYYTWKNIKDEYENNRFKLSAPTWEEIFDIPDGSYTVEDIQDYFLWIIKKHKPTIKPSEESPILIIQIKLKTG